MLNIAIILVTTALAALLGSMRGGRIMTRHPDTTLENAHRHLREVYLIVPVCAIATAATVAIFTRPGTLWPLPAWLDPHSTAILHACAAGALFYMLAAGLRIAFASRHRERGKLLFAAALVFIGLDALFIKSAMPIHGTLHETRSVDRLVLQSSPHSCAAASLANIVLLLGGKASETEMAKLAGTSMQGTTPGQIIRALDHLGIKGRKAILTPEELMQLEPPAMLLVDSKVFGPLSHAVVYEGMLNGDFAIIDPHTGRHLSSPKKLAAEWSGHAILLERKQNPPATPPNTRKK